MFKKILLAILILLVATVAIFWTTIHRLYVLSNINEPNKIAEYFQSFESIATYNLIQKSSQPSPLPFMDTLYELPKTFHYESEVLNTEEFLNHTLSTGLMILKNGKIIYEAYDNGLKPETSHISFSVAKSYTSTLIGLAIEDGLIESEHDLITKYLPQFKNTGYDGPTIADCMEMSSGVKFNEDYGDKNSDISKFQKHFALGKAFEDFLLTIEPKIEAGTYNDYNSMDAQIVGHVLHAVLKGKSLATYTQEKIWEPLGMQDDAQWVTDNVGMEMTLGGLNVSLRDYAKFGQLFLQDGQWNGQQILPKGWVKKATTPDEPKLMPGKNNPHSAKSYGYKYLWWTPEVPMNGDYFASGIYNQYIYINPEKQLVIAKTSANPHFTKSPEEYKGKYIQLFQTIAKSL